ncbi:MAG: orotidine-5'-phosphate decarboxylase [Anaerolineae bacterium]
MTTFFTQLEQRARAINSLLCVGLDPQPEKFGSAQAVLEFCKRLVDQTRDLACAYKPNSAFFEVWGGAGYDALSDLIAYIPHDIPVILDAKRGDIASTASAYAKSAFETLGAGAITLSPYLGEDGVQPFLAHTGKGVFVLCKTSNPGASEFQDLPVSGQSLYETIARTVTRWEHADRIGLVVGATDPAALHCVRVLAPKAWLLVPGVGAQGGDLDAAVTAGLRPDGLGVLINASRSIADASDPKTESRRLRDAINAARTQTPSTRAGQPAYIEPVARALAESGCVKFGSFTLKSGKTSPFYLDLRRLVAYPDKLQIIGVALAELLETLHFDHIAAIPYAALPIGTAASLHANRSLLYPRREAKSYGTGVNIEGVFEAGDTAVVLDDLATTGETKIETIDKLKSAGLAVNDIVVVIDREQGAAAMLEGLGYHFHALVTLSQLLPVWEAQGFLSADHRRDIETYLAQDHV